MKTPPRAFCITCHIVYNMTRVFARLNGIKDDDDSNIMTSELKWH